MTIEDLKKAPSIDALGAGPGTAFYARLDGLLRVIGAERLDSGAEAATVAEEVVRLIRQEAMEIAERIDRAWPPPTQDLFAIEAVPGFAELLTEGARAVYEKRVRHPTIAMACAVGQIFEISVLDALTAPGGLPGLLEHRQRKTMERIAAVFNEGVRREAFTDGVLRDVLRLRLHRIGPVDQWLLLCYPLIRRPMDELNEAFGFVAITKEAALPAAWPDLFPWERTPA